MISAALRADLLPSAGSPSRGVLPGFGRKRPQFRASRSNFEAGRAKIKTKQNRSRQPSTDSRKRLPVCSFTRIQNRAKPHRVEVHIKPIEIPLELVTPKEYFVHT